MQHPHPPRCAHPWLGLRTLRHGDVPAWHACLSAPGALEHSSWVLDSVADLEAEYARYASADPASPSRWAIVDTRDGRLLGSIGFHSVEPARRKAEIAYDLAPAAWGQGLATAACLALCRYGFERLGYLRIQATVLDSNLASRRVLEKAGFAREGLLRRYRLVRGQPRDFLMYARLSDGDEHPA